VEVRAVLAVSKGLGSLEVKDVPDPTPGAGQQLIRVVSAGINFSDIGAIEGTYPGPPPPFVPGIEVAGRELGSDRPVLALLDSGGYGELVVADERLVIAADGLDLETAGGLPLVLLAAYFGLVRAARLEAGETVLVLAAGGALGSTAIQVARALGAGRVIGVASSDEKRAIALDRGADVAVPYSSDLPQADVVIDGVGGAAFLDAYRATRRFGRVLTVGASSGAPPELPSFQEQRNRSVAIVPFSFKALRAADPDYVAASAPAAIDLVRSGAVSPVIGESFPLAQAAEALRRLAARESVGKLLLRP
jgi:NADPH2:quinone reductase